MRNAIFALTALLPLGGCGGDMCTNREMSRADAPDGRHSAVMFDRDCSATTGYTVQISILGPGQQPSDGGNAFVADRPPWAKMTWVAPDHLVIRYASESRVFHQEARVDGVLITYEHVGKAPATP